MSNNLTVTDRFMVATFLKIVPKFVRPNHFTVVRFFIIPIVFWVLWLEFYVCGIALFAISAFTDVLDGSLARTRNQRTKWGTLFDPLADKILIGTSAGVLMWRFLNMYLFTSTIAVEVVLIVGAFVQKLNRECPIKAHISGKMKMILQTLGTIGLLVYAMFALEIFIPISYAFYILGLCFGVVSLLVYKSV